MKRTGYVLVLFGVLHFSPQPCTAGGSTNGSRASPLQRSHSATHDEEESRKMSSHPITEAPIKGSIKETHEDHILKDRNEKQAVLTGLPTDLDETHTAPQLPQKRQNEGGTVQHARKRQNEHKVVSPSSAKGRFSECNVTGRRGLV
ncbi:hypothetical protein V1264_017611 [Littorina saxatilis]|uniref:Secreted protein n=1 Tax=Littorina saxatilis TaxID=31220 RepID=A0AAN9AS68_9CAEN